MALDLMTMTAKSTMNDILEDNVKTVKSLENLAFNMGCDIEDCTTSAEIISAIAKNVGSTNTEKIWREIGVSQYNTITEDGTAYYTFKNLTTFNAVCITCNGYGASEDIKASFSVMNASNKALGVGEVDMPVIHNIYAAGFYFNYDGFGAVIFNAFGQSGSCAPPPVFGEEVGKIVFNVPDNVSLKMYVIDK